MHYDEMYYHGLSGDIDNNVKLQVEKSLSRLESIIKFGGLLSKSMLIKNGLSDYIGKPVFNGNDYVSLCVKYFPLEELEGINEGFDSSYNKYIEDCLSIVIDKSNGIELPIIDNDHNLLIDNSKLLLRFNSFFI